ncbi:MAG: thermonuclease family protein [Chloroflexi bacterium]|nr:thermonuclease family protein [Chloroflexota bacterium]
MKFLGLRWRLTALKCRRSGWRVAAVAALAWLAAACGDEDLGGDSEAEAPPSQVFANVVDVIDGDTIEVAIDGATETVRYIGIDTPEIGQRCAAEATEANRRIVSGQRVMLVRDMENRDIYDRLLRYVYLDGELVELKLVEFGLARPLKIFPNVTHSDEIAEAARTAKANGIGCLWDPELLAEARRLKSLATPTPTPSERIVVEKMNYNAAGDDRNNLNDEYLTLINLGPDLQIEGWTVSDASDNVYRFGKYEWRTGTRLTLRTGSGVARGGVFYWKSETPIWNNAGETLTLGDGSGNTVLVYVYPN